MVKKRPPMPKDRYEGLAKACKDDDKIDFLSVLKGDGKNRHDGGSNDKHITNSNVTYFEVKEKSTPGYLEIR